MSATYGEAEWIWKNGAFVPWAEATLHLLSTAVQFGSSVFEGIRCYETPDGPATDLVCWIAAADLLANWSDGAEEFFEAFAQVAKHRTTDTGLGRSFGLLLRDAVQLEKLCGSTRNGRIKNGLLVKSCRA